MSNKVTKLYEKIKISKDFDLLNYHVSISLKYIFGEYVFVYLIKMLDKDIFKNINDAILNSDYCKYLYITGDDDEILAHDIYCIAKDIYNKNGDDQKQTIIFGDQICKCDVECVKKIDTMLDIKHRIKDYGDEILLVITINISSKPSSCDSSLSWSTTNVRRRAN